MAWDIREVTTTVTVTHDGETAEVTIRKMSEGDKQDIADAAAQDGRVLPGTLRRVLMERAVVAWTVPVPLTPDALRNLPTTVAEDIFEAISDFNGDMGEDADPPTETS